jgi:hypothetical protein
MCGEEGRPYAADLRCEVEEWLLRLLLDALVVKDAGDAELNKLVKREAGKAVSLGFGDKRRIDIEDLRLH